MNDIGLTLVLLFAAVIAGFFGVRRLLEGGTLRRQAFIAFGIAAALLVGVFFGAGHAARRLLGRAEPAEAMSKPDQCLDLIQRGAAACETRDLDEAQRLLAAAVNIAPANWRKAADAVYAAVLGELACQSARKESGVESPVAVEANKVARKAWGDVLPLTQLPPNALALATARLNALAAEERERLVYQRVLKLHADGLWREAIAAANTLPRRSGFRRPLETRLDEARAALVAEAHRQLPGLLRERKWVEAQTAALDAQMIDVKRAGEFAPELKRIEAGLAQRDLVRTAEEAFAAGAYADALKALEGVIADGPYAAEREVIAAKAHALLAQAMYREGKGAEALVYLQQNGLQKEPVFEHVREVITMSAAADGAMGAGDYDGAQASWQKLLTVEPDEQNAYRKHAKNKLASWKADAVANAQAVLASADEAYQRKDYVEARRRYERALRYDPDHALGKEGVAEVRKQAMFLYNRARNLQREGKTEQALDLFRATRDLLREGERYYAESAAEIAKEAAK